MPQYIIDFEKINAEILKDNDNFKGVTSVRGNDYKINESVEEHFTQILWIIHEDCYMGNKWVGWEEPFSKEYLHELCKKDFKIYLSNWGEIANKFVEEFPQKIDYFVEHFCKC